MTELHDIAVNAERKAELREVRGLAEALDVLSPNERLMVGREMAEISKQRRLTDGALPEIKVTEFESTNHLNHLHKIQRFEDWNFSHPFSPLSEPTIYEIDANIDSTRLADGTIVEKEYSTDRSGGIFDTEAHYTYRISEEHLHPNGQDELWLFSPNSDPEGYGHSTSLRKHSVFTADPSIE